MSDLTAEQKMVIDGRYSCYCHVCAKCCGPSCATIIKHLIAENKKMAADEAESMADFPPFIVEAGGIQCGDDRGVMDLDTIRGLLTEQRRANIEMHAKVERLLADFDGGDLEQVRAKCEQYWNENVTLCPEEMHAILEFIHARAWGTEEELERERAARIVETFPDCDNFREKMAAAIRAKETT